MSDCVKCELKRIRREISRVYFGAAYDQREDRYYIAASLFDKLQEIMDRVEQLQEHV